MSVLIGIALKSLLIAGLTLGLLRLMNKRSAAERSWIAHVGLFALVLMALAPVVLPSWNIEGPRMFAAPQPSPVAQSLPATHVVATPTPAVPVAKPVTGQTASLLSSLSPAAAATALYAVPAAILLLITFLALARLVALQARADVLVDGHWLSALARAQRRMGFKHGTALLTSNELASPISWGVIRPVIVLNSRAVEAADEAEAIIAHELAHVARMDWVKLLLARIATSLFWFNPLVWLLAREAHQLREETADDSVLAANIVDTDYAQLLVGVARHECPGLLLGAHGVAPSKSSLARRVARVLDGKSVRGPAARPFALGVFAGAVIVAAPLAALTVTQPAPRAQKAATNLAANEPQAPYYPVKAEQPTDLPSIIAQGVSTSVTTAVAAATAVAPQIAKREVENFRAEAPNGATVERINGMVVSTSPTGASVTVYPADSQGHKKIVARGPNGATSVTYVDANDDVQVNPRDRTIHKIIEMKAVGVTPEYISAMRAAVPQLSGLGFDQFTGMRAVGVTPEFARDLVASGFPSITADQLVEARTIGVTGDYVRAMRSTGLRGDIADFVQLRAVGVDPAFAARVKASGIKVVNADDLVELKALGISKVPAPPRTPVPPRGWNPNPDPGG